MGTYIDENGKAVNRGTESPAGNIVVVSMKKNKTCPPTRRTGFYTLRYQTGIDYLSDLIEVAMKYGIVEVSGSWYRLVDIDTGEFLGDKVQGQNKLAALLDEDVEILQRVEELINSRINSDEVSLDGEPEE